MRVRDAGVLDELLARLHAAAVQAGQRNIAEGIAAKMTKAPRRPFDPVVAAGMRWRQMLEQPAPDDVDLEQLLDQDFGEMAEAKGYQTAKKFLDVAEGRDAGVTFKQAAEQYIEAHKAGWKNPVHAAQWPSSLRDYVYPKIGKLSVSAVNTEHVLQCLQPIWTTKTETASRVRGRIEAMLDYAKFQGWRDGENPARWRGHLAITLPKKSKVQKVEHDAALDWRKLPAFMEELSQRDHTTAALALQFTVLTACRTGEVIGATWGEIDGNVWVIPPERMKAGKKHRVPLSTPALAVLETLKARRLPRHKDWIFPGRKDRPISNMTMLMALRKTGHADLTAHGFRATFRTWCADHGQAPDLAEGGQMPRGGHLYPPHRHVQEARRCGAKPCRNDLVGQRHHGGGRRSSCLSLRSGKGAST